MSEPVATEADVVLQTRSVPADLVRNEIHKWRPAMQDEYDSLVAKTDAVKPLSDEEFRSLAADATQQIELIPGRALFTVKAPQGRLKARVVACGNFQSSAAREREDTFASGISAEGVRILLRLAALEQFDIGSIDVKTAFLNAPVVTPNQEKVIVRVPGILRTAGICTEKYRLVQKALYGLDVAPRSWSLHRNGILQSIKTLEDGTPVEVRPLDEDVNIWRVSRQSDHVTITWLALYVDDMLLVGKTTDVQCVATTLQKLWTTTPVQWATNEEPLTFDGFETQKHKESVRISQKNYITALLSMYPHVDGVSTVPAVRDPDVKHRTGPENPKAFN